MHLSHPMAPYQGIPIQDVFIASNDQMIQLGLGYVMLTYQGEMYPERPLHLYVHIESHASARSLLFGALLARGMQMRTDMPELKGRMYTQLAPDDWDMMNFYSKCGFVTDDSEDLYRFGPPEWSARVPISCRTAPVPLSSEAERLQFLQRINAYRIEPIDTDFLTMCMQQPYFSATGFYRGNQPVCEMLMTGAGTAATLVMIYVRSDYRRQGMAKAMIAAACESLREKGVRQINAGIFSRNVPQAALMRSAKAKKIRSVMLYPGINFDL